MRLDNLEIIRLKRIISQNQDVFSGFRLDLSHPVGFKDQEYNMVYIQVVKNGLCDKSISSRFEELKKEDGEIPKSTANWKYQFYMRATLNPYSLNEVVIKYHFLSGKKAAEQHYDNSILSDEKAGSSIVQKIIELLLGVTSDSSSYWYQEAGDNTNNLMNLWFSYK
jgi:hypothetical protein